MFILLGILNIIYSDSYLLKIVILFISGSLLLISQYVNTYYLSICEAVSLELVKYLS